MPDHLDPSELGTKEYWDTLYARELQNHTEDGDDQGTIWFEESNAEATVVRELDRLAEEGLLDKQSATFLDLGTGNGHMLQTLRLPEDDDGDDDAVLWNGDMIGVDYSTASIDLARRICGQRHSRDAASTDGNLRFETWDLLTESPGPWLPSGGAFDVILDKGTFDAISLMHATDGASHPCVTYRNKIGPLVREGGFLVVTSCNWTSDELTRWLAPESSPSGLHLFREATYPSFTFGGKKGQSIVTIIFRREAP